MIDLGTLESQVVQYGKMEKYHLDVAKMLDNQANTEEADLHRTAAEGCAQFRQLLMSNDGDITNVMTDETHFESYLFNYLEYYRKMLAPSMPEGAVNDVIVLREKLLRNTWEFQKKNRDDAEKIKNELNQRLDSALADFVNGSDDPMIGRYLTIGNNPPYDQTTEEPENPPEDDGQG